MISHVCIFRMVGRSAQTDLENDKKDEREVGRSADRQV